MFKRSSGIGYDDAHAVDHGELEIGSHVITAGGTSVHVNIDSETLTVDLGSISPEKKRNVIVDSFGRADGIPSAVRKVVLDETGFVFVAGGNLEGEGVAWQSIGPVRQERG